MLLTSEACHEKPPMRLVLALLIAVVTAAGPSVAQEQKAKPSDEILRQRLLLRERFNKGWEVQNETPRERKARCRGETRKKFSAMHPIKRRMFMKECMERPGR